MPRTRRTKSDEDNQPPAKRQKVDKKGQKKVALPKKSYSKKIKEDTCNSVDGGEQNSVEDIKYEKPLPVRNKKGELVFEDWPEIRPNMTPKEVLHAGSFGGTYFRPIKSGVTGKSYSGVWKELPKDWLEGLNIERQVSSSVYHEDVNTYKVKCGGSLQMWEESGWMHKQDPYGWFQWYCRFYWGRRTDDDERQIGRWLRCAGVTGRWKNNLISKCVKSGCAYDNSGVSPVVRQTLQHWAYKLTKDDFDARVKVMKRKGAA